jgi:putative transposase
MSDYRVRLEVGHQVLVPSGLGLVTRVFRMGYSIKDRRDDETEVPWTDLVETSNIGAPGRAAHISLKPMLESVSTEAAQEMEDWLEVVNTILTGYARGFAELALDGEPVYPYGPTFGVSRHQQFARMAAELNLERTANRELARRVRRGEVKSATITASTVRNKVEGFELRGAVGLIDGRRVRRKDTFGTIDNDFRAAIDQVIETLDGDRSTIADREILRVARVAMKKRGIHTFHAPHRATQQYISWRKDQKGTTTRAQRSTKLRGASAFTSFEAVRPGQVVAIDATRADVLVWDPLHERALSVEILTAIDVCTRVVVALRVVPKSADGVDAGLLLYDVLRPFSCHVSGTKISDWRWVGLPNVLDLTETDVRTEEGPIAKTGPTLQGEHGIPSLIPGAIRADHGSIFVSSHFRMLLHDFGIDLMLSRGSRPVDNAFIERLHETYQRAYQALPGFKGRNVGGRGRKVEHEPLCTAAELEAHLRRWVALDYHQSWHQGLVLPEAPRARLTPLDLYDAKVAATGRIDVPQTPTLLYQFLPIRWGTVRHAGVEFDNLAYDAQCLDGFRNRPRGWLRAKDAAMPFFYDPHDVSRVWWEDPETFLVHEIPWHSQHKFDAPMNDKVLKTAVERIRQRGGNRELNIDSTQRLILKELTELYTAKPTPDWRAISAAAARRVESSARDHAEAQFAQAEASGPRNLHRLDARARPGERAELPGDAWPDYDAQGY